MNPAINKVKTISKKVRDVYKAEGLLGFSTKAAKYAYYRQYPDRKKSHYKDILFINGCALPHPARFRVDHQIEQLAAAGVFADQLFYDQLNIDQLKYYRGFVFFRCPVTDTIREFILEAKRCNKACIFDIDDLVIDQKYTDQIKYIQDMPESDKRLYDDGVNRMRETLELCDIATTTTERLAAELSHYTKEVYINRNYSSDEMIRTSLDAVEQIERDESKTIIGYFSGTITHNEDFEMILPSLVKLLKKHPRLYLKVVGILDTPAELEPYRDRLISVDFMDWRKMPQEVATCDILVAPLVKSIFNEAKSENKWMEAALVSLPIVASDFGAFKKTIRNYETGVLVGDNGWFDALDELIMNKTLRESIGAAAHHQLIENHTTVGNAYHYAAWLRSKLARSIAFVLPTTDISGGVTVVLKHADILREHGWDVTLIDSIDKKSLKRSVKSYSYRVDIPSYNVLTAASTEFDGHFDTITATLWSTLKFVKEYPNVKHRKYFVQSFETDFLGHGSGTPRFLANATYCDDTNIKYITMSPWCRLWLKEKFEKNAEVCSNGIYREYYPFRKREFTKGKKVKILIEGDSKSPLKNTDEAFRVIDKLDPKKYEISYLSYRKEPKKWYRVDHFYNRIAPEKVGEVYARCDILIKTSLLESFSYPPLEMMATGGYAIVIPNGGNAEYLQDGENCLLFEHGDVEGGVAAVERIVSDKSLRKKLETNSLATAERYRWENVEKGICDLYD